MLLTVPVRSEGTLLNIFFLPRVSPMKCKICSSQSLHFFTAQVLNRYEVDYFQCSSCGFVQTEEPYWLAEAYKEAIASSDVGYVLRNTLFSKVTSHLIFNLLEHDQRFLDYGGGYGLFTRIMRDWGYDFFWSDKFCENIFAKGFEGDLQTSQSYELITAFEVFEHLTDPLETIATLLESTDNIFFSTELLPDSNPTPENWWYYNPQEGQHIAIYTPQSLLEIAQRFNLNVYSNSLNLHLLTRRDLSSQVFAQCLNFNLPEARKGSLTEGDFVRVSEALKEKSLIQHSPGTTSQSQKTTKPFKIVIDGIFFQIGQTGIARVWQSLLMEWAANGFAKHILVLDRNDTAPKIPGVRYCLLSAFSYRNVEEERSLLQQICDEEGADLFISTYYTAPTRTQSVVMVHDMIPEVLGQYLSNPMWQEKHWSIRQASHYICVSRNTARDLQKFFPQISEEQITTAHNGVDLSFQPVGHQVIQEFKARYGITKPYYLLMGSRMGWMGYKNTILFFKAFTQLKNKQDFEIVCVGHETSLEPEFLPYITDTRVHLLPLTDVEVPMAYSGAVALVYPSKYEGFGLPILEAMACGCPVITCANASIPEVAGDAALYVGDEDTQGLTLALQQVQQSEVRNRLTQKGLAQAKQFSWQRTAEQVRSVLLKAVSQPLSDDVEQGSSSSASVKVFNASRGMGGSAASQPFPSPAETIQRYRLRDYNLLAFPDWEQSEEQLFESLSQLFQGILLHPQRTRMTLLLDATGVDPETADWAISSVVMHLMEQMDVEPEGAPEIVLLSEMESDPTKGEAPLQRWRVLLPFVAARVLLARESSMVEVCAEVGTVTSCPVDSLLEANLQTFRFAQEAAIKAQLSQGWEDAKSLPCLLAAMQYFYPHEVDWQYDLPRIPQWLLQPFMNYLLENPPLFHQIGESASYLHFVQKLTAYLHQEILQNQRSPFWQEIAEFFILRLHLIPLYFNQEDLRGLFRQRAEILEAVLTHQGTAVEHSFREREGDRHKIRLGILATHFYPETETFATLPVFQHLDRQKFEVTLYSIESFNHRLSQYCTQQADSAVELPRTTDGRVARIREDDLDILFIASNVTAVTNWVTLLAPHRMARIQVVGMNSPVSTEMTHIDYYLSSRLTHSSFDVQRHYRETVVQIDGPAQCFDFATEAQPVPTQTLSREALGIAPDAVVFVSGANFHKITPELEATWARIIAGVPNAVLLLYPFNISWSSEYPEAAFRDRLAASFAREGVSADRFLLLPNAPNRGDVLERLKLADVYLDSHPFSGMTSLVDPLQLSLPPIVMELDLPVSLARGAAFLRDLEVPELIVESEAEYVQLAIALGTQPERRQQLRDRILRGMAKTPGFMDSRRYGEEMSRVFESLFEAYQKQVPVAVTPAQPKTVSAQPPLQMGQPIARYSMRGALLQIKQLGFKPATVIDVGAALGTFDLYELFPQSRHILIEPIVENEPYLAKICKKLGNAEYHIAAAASEPGTLTLSVNPGLVNASLVTAGDATAPTSEMRTMKVISLDQLHRDRHLQPPFLVKVDVDGKEMEVLKGAVQVLQATEYIIIESTCFGQINEVVDFMREHGFAIYDMVDPVYRPGDHALWQVDLAFVKQSGQFRQSRSYVASSTDDINQQQVWEHHHRYRAQLIDYIERNYGESEEFDSKANTDLGFTPKPITWIAFPDWQQSEETLFEDLTQAVRQVLKAGGRQHMLLLDASTIDSDDANLLLADTLMYLLQDEGLEVDENGPEIVLLSEIHPNQWNQLVPSLSARIKLAHEGAAVRLNLAVDLPVVELEPR